jgi:hypothetical protein
METHAGLVCQARRRLRSHRFTEPFTFENDRRRERFADARGADIPTGLIALYSKGR